MNHLAYVLTIAAAGITGITLGIAPSVIHRIKHRRTR
jgi:hypothetical protein